MELSQLNDEELIAKAREWRLLALRGEQHARGIAHELECEVRRRSRTQASGEHAAKPDLPPPASAGTTRRRHWSFW